MELERFSAADNLMSAAAAHLQVKGEGAGKATIAMQARDSAADAAERGAVGVHNGVLASDRAFLLDCRLHLWVCQYLIIKHRPVAVHLRKEQTLKRVSTTASLMTAFCCDVADDGDG